MTKSNENNIQKTARRVACFRCEGVAVYPCPYCGSTRRDCKICNGNALTCKICDGRGYLEEEIDLNPQEADISKC